MNWRGFFSCFMVALGTVAFGYPSAIIAPTLAKASFLKYMGLGDEEGIFSDKEGLAGALTGVFQVCARLLTSRLFVCLLRESGHVTR